MDDNKPTTSQSSISWESGEADNAKQELMDEMNNDDPAGGKTTPPPEVSWEGDAGEEGDPPPASGDPSGEGDEGGEDTMFYNPSELYPDEEIHPNQYKTKFDAAQGVVNKARMLYENYSQMKEAGVDPNAMDLPSYLDGDIDNLKQFFDVSQVAEMEDDKIVSVIYESDKFIPEVKELAKSQKSEYELNNQINELLTDLNKAKDPLFKSINDRFGISLADKSIDSDQKLLSKMDQLIDQADEDDAGDLRSIKQEYIDFAKKVDQYDTLLKKKEAGDVQQGYTEEDAKKAFRQFVKLNPNSDVNKFPEVRESFGAWIEIHGSKYDLGKSSGWKQAERAYMNVISDLKNKYNAKQAQQEAKKKKPAKSTPPPTQRSSETKSDPYREQMRDIRREKEQLKREMNLGR